MRSWKQDVALHYSMIMRSIAAAISIGILMNKRENKPYISENTWLIWVRVEDQLKMLRRSLQNDFKAYKKRVDRWSR